MQNALLATFNVSIWSVARTNRKISRDVNRDLTERPSMAMPIGRYVKNLINTSAPEYRAVCKARDLGRKLHYAYTLPWQEGLRLLNPLALDDYNEQMDNAERIFKSAVNDFIAAYPRLITEAENALTEQAQKKYFRKSDYPTVDLLAELFAMSTAISPLPHDSQFDAVSDLIGTDQAEILADKLKAQQTEQWADAAKSVWQRLFDALKHASNQLNNGDRIHDSVLNNLQEITDLLPILNVTNDSELEHRRQELQSLFRSYSPEIVRGTENKSNRNNCAAAVDEILARITL